MYHWLALQPKYLPTKYTLHDQSFPMVKMLCQVSEKKNLHKKGVRNDGVDYLREIWLKNGKSLKHKNGLKYHYNIQYQCDFNQWKPS